MISNKKFSCGKVSFCVLNINIIIIKSQDNKNHLVCSRFVGNPFFFQKHVKSTKLKLFIEVFLFSSVLLAWASADSCSDCTSVVNVVKARLMSEESIQQQGVLKIDDYS